MLEVTFFDNDLEIATCDVQASDLYVGAIVEGMEILNITLNPPTGEDALVSIAYI